MREEHPMAAAARTRHTRTKQKTKLFQQTEDERNSKRNKEEKKTLTHTEDEQIKEQPIQREPREDEAEK